MDDTVDWGQSEVLRRLREPKARPRWGSGQQANLRGGNRPAAPWVAWKGENFASSFLLLNKSCPWHEIHTPFIGGFADFDA